MAVAENLDVCKNAVIKGVNEVTIADVWRILTKLAMAAWARTSKRLRMVGAVVLFLYVILVIPSSISNTKTNPPQISHNLPLQINPPINPITPHPLRLPNLRPQPQNPSLQIQRNQSSPPHREPPKSHPRPPNPPLHLGRAPGLALPLHGLARKRRAPQQIRRHPRASHRGQARSNVYPVQHEHGVAGGDLALFNKPLVVRDCPPAGGAPPYLPDG